VLRHVRNWWNRSSRHRARHRTALGRRASLTARASGGLSTGSDLDDLTAGGFEWHHLGTGATGLPQTRRDEFVAVISADAPPAFQALAEGLRVSNAERSVIEAHPPDAQRTRYDNSISGWRSIAGSANSSPISAGTDRPESGFSYDDTPIAALTQAAIRALTGSGPAMPRPARRRTLVVANQKGGVGKTTTTVNLAAALATHGCRVLVIDLDPQGNASTALGIDHFTGTPSVYEVIIEGRPLAEVIQQCEAIPSLLCAPATIDLAGAEIELVSLVAREGRLRRALEDYSNDVDYIFIDCPPSLGLLTINALVAAAELLIPIQCEYYAMEGLGQLLKNVDLVRAHLNPHLAISTILLTMYDARTRLASQVADEVRQHFEGVVLKTTIPRSVRVSEAPSYGQTVITYDPASTGALAYVEAAREIAADGQAGLAPPMARTSFANAGRASVSAESTSRPHLEPDADHPASSRRAESATWAGATFSPVQTPENDAGADWTIGEAEGWDTAWTSAPSSRSSRPEERHQ
jgi:chromosome partitioning protein